MIQGTSDLLGAVTGRKVGVHWLGKDGDRAVQGMLRAGIAAGDAIRASDPLPAARTLLEAETGIKVYESNLPVVQQSDVVVLAVKPQSMHRFWKTSGRP